jgi:ribosomal protein S12 methylthiotransferase
MNIGIVSLGCSKNLVDTQNILRLLKQDGHRITDDPDQADAIIVNTCGFITAAKQESIDAILDMAARKQGRCRVLIVTGCLVQRYREELKKELPEVDCFIPLSDYPRLPEILRQYLPPEGHYPCGMVLATNPWTAYLRIADGCSNACAFCAIPQIRGRYRSVPLEELLAQAGQLRSIGVSELNVIAQDTTKYGLDLYHKLMLGELLKQLDAMDFHWIRVLYLYPDELTEELIDTMASLKHVLPYFDIPTQHASDRLLKAMRRRGDSRRTAQLVRQIRARFPDPTLRTTVIVGFPGETAEDFRQLMDSVAELRWDHLGAFEYSREENTAAYDMHPQIASRVAHSRYQRLMALQQQISWQQGQQYVGSRQEVLIEGKDGLRDLYIGRTSHHAPDDIDGLVRLRSRRPLTLGSYVPARITAARAYDWEAELVPEDK